MFYTLLFVTGLLLCFAEGLVLLHAANSLRSTVVCFCVGLCSR